MTDSDRLLSRASFEKMLIGEPMTKRDIERVLKVMESPGIIPHSMSPEEMAGLRSSLISFLKNWQESLQQQGQQ